jgi:redox-sensing transcriptional repressor
MLTVPANEAQHVADRLVALGIMAIWNFAPKDIKVPSRVVLQRTDLATSFAVLSAKVKRVMEHREFNEEEDDLW